MKILFYILILSGLGITCTRNTDEAREIDQISYGTSFGMCMGYCRFNMVIEPGSVTYLKAGWDNSVNTVSCKEDLNADQLEALTDHINIESFMELPQTIGCPDCADGGAEWVEITTANGTKHKVTFEYGNAPEELDELVDAISEIRNNSSGCEDFR